jgi:hypothetical protein
VTREQMAGVRYALNPQVLHEAIDGEVIVIDLATGSYYSLRGSAADVWQLLAGSPGATSAELVGALAQRYESDDTEMEPAVSRFIEQLSEENLVAGIDGSTPPRAAAAFPEPEGAAARAFDPPVLEKYTDMQDLVLLDPVHEVDQTGWPRLPDAASNVSTA